MPRSIKHGEDYTLGEAEQMLDWITGDNPPDLEHWNCRDWMNLHGQFHHLKAEIGRLRVALFSARRDCEFIAHREEDEHEYGERCPVEARIDAALHTQAQNSSLASRVSRSRVQR